MFSLCSAPIQAQGEESYFLLINNNNNNNNRYFSIASDGKFTIPVYSEFVNLFCNIIHYKPETPTNDLLEFLWTIFKEFALLQNGAMEYRGLNLYFCLHWKFGKNFL